jgi:O-antigen/teichoic acid export membrane protein
LVKKNSYNDVLKSTTFFGGVQIIQILIQFIRSKTIAIILGPTGIGFFGLLTSSLSLIESFTNLGISSSSVNAISSKKNDPHALQTQLSIVRGLIIWSATIGLFIVLIFAPQISLITFGSKKYAWVFYFTAISVFFNQLYSGSIAIYQGLRYAKSIGRVNLIGSFSSLIIVIPLIFIYKNDSLVPCIIISSFLLFASSYLENRRKKIQFQPLNKILVLKEGKNILSLGLMISLANVLTLLTGYLMRVIINEKNGFDAVGLYSSGFTILNTYVGLVFSAMALDYYPRISENSSNSSILNQMVNEQAEIALLLLTPIILLFILFDDLLIKLMYSSSFLPIVPMLFWSSIGILFKSSTWSMGYIFLAKKHSRLFFINELIGNIIFLVLNYFGYKYWGLTGLGISFTLSNIFNLIMVYCIVKTTYQFSFTLNYFRILLSQLVFVIILMFLSELATGNMRILMGLLCFICSVGYSFFVIRKNTSNSTIIQYINKLF